MQDFGRIVPLEGYRSDIGLLLAITEDSTREWQGELEQPPIEAITWQPEPGSYSIGGILLHSAWAELFWCSSIAETKITESQIETFMRKETNVDGGVWPTPPKKDIGWFFEQHKIVRHQAFEVLKGIDPDKVMTLRDHEFSLIWILGHLIQHDSYHGGQAVILHELWKKQNRGQHG